jgi:hypothetical protein
MQGNGLQNWCFVMSIKLFLNDSNLILNIYFINDLKLTADYLKLKREKEKKNGNITN